MIRKIANFCVKAFIAAKDTVVNFIRGTYQHAETITVLVLASFGVSALLGELPFLVALPMWVEQAMIVPVASVLIISGLIKLAEWRAKRRMFAHG